MLEGVFGQIFLVTIVALVVSNLGVERRQLRHTMAEPRADPADRRQPADDGRSTEPSTDRPGDAGPDPAEHGPPSARHYRFAVPVYLIRHAHAGSRSGWDGDDDRRPLSPKGRARRPTG